MNPLENLHQYTTKAKLLQMKYLDDFRAPPKPPRQGHKSHRNLLHVRPEHWRQLEFVYKLKKSAFAERVLQCTSK